MRKVIAPVLVLIALLATVGTAIPTFAQLATADPFASHTAHPDFIVVKRGVTPNSGGGGGGFTPAQLNKAYGISALKNKGSGVTVAIIDACGNTHAQADLNAYDSTYHLPKTTIKVVTPEGQPCSDPQGWGVEADLDLQMVHAIAPAAHIVLEAAQNASFSDLDNAVKDAYTHQGASVISMSFGGSEFSGETGSTGDGIFSAGSNLGVSFTASTGDNGCGAQYPAASPFVTSVGGTSLTTQSNGTYVSESAWNGSGGGLSAFESRPSYQNGFNRNANRGIPDVAMVADPNTGVSMYDSDLGGFIIVGGTSVSAPMWAGVLSLADGKRSSSMKNADKELYGVVAGNASKYATDYHDVKTGSAGSKCNAGTGYDLVTGLGSPAANVLVPDVTAAP